MVFKTNQDWREASRCKREAVLAAVPVQWRLDPAVIKQARSRRNVAGEFIEELLSQPEAAITKLETSQLADKIASRELTAEAVTTAYCKRAAYAHQLVNCLHEIFFDLALDRARKLDDHLAEVGSVVGPLHGVPVSLKDQFHVEGVETTMGYVGWIGTFEGRLGAPEWKTVNSQVVEELLSLGAVLFCKTSLPQTLLLGETHNNIIGYTSNPINQNLSCGGSSGGEGALQALGASSIGFGTDIGGSVRIPSSFCGTFSIKPSTTRLSYRKVANTMPGQTIVKSAVGIMGTALPSLKLMMQAILSTEPWRRDSEVSPIPWRPSEEVQSSTKLCFGIMPFDGVVRVHPPIARGIQIVQSALQAAGHKVISWQPPSHSNGQNIHSRFIESDGGADVFRQLRLSGEPLIPEKAIDMGNQPQPPIPTLQYQKACIERRDYRDSYATYWEETKGCTDTGRPVDAFIMPVAPHAAVIPGKYFHYGYSEIINLLDYSSVTIPVTHADKTVDILDQEYVPINDLDRDNWDSYEAEVYDGAPVGIQIVGRGLQEERILSITSIVLDALKT